MKAKILSPTDLLIRFLFFRLYSIPNNNDIDAKNNGIKTLFPTFCIDSL